MEEKNLDKRLFHNISPKSWEHPADRAALAALRQIPGLDQVLKIVLGLLSDKAIRLAFLSSSVRTSPKQFPKVHNMLREACSVLDVKEIPELYVIQNPMFNAVAAGVDKPIIGIHSSLVDTLTEDELLAVIAHELGHCLSGHVLYKNLLVILLNVSLSLLNIPLAPLVLYSLIAALREWDRKSELTADRAGLLVTQNPEVNYSLLMKMAGGRHTEQMNIEEFFKQAEEYDKGGTVVDSLHKVLNTVWTTHPFPVIRLTELKSWVDSGDYDKILRGDYRKRSANDKDDVLKDFEEAGKQYKSDFERSEDPLMKSFDSMAKGMEKGFQDMSKQAGKMFDDLFKGVSGEDDEKDKDKDK